MEGGERGYDRHVTERADVIVIGAGIIGCAIAYQLARRGAAVRLFDARAIGAGATQASAGVLAPYIESPSPGPLLDLAARSLSMYDRFISDLHQDSGIDVEYRLTGTLEVMTEPDAATHAKENVHEGGEWFDTASAVALEPSLPPTIHGAILTRAHGYVVAPQLTEALTWAALRYGAEMETGRRVAGIERRGDDLEIRTDDGERWIAGRVVIAAGSWAAQVGVADRASAAVRPIRGQLIRLAWPARSPRHVLWGPDCYVVPWRDGSVLVGATVEDVGFDERTTAAGVRDLLDAVCELVPAAWGATFREARVGLRPATSDGLPIIGPSGSMPGVIYATGHYRNGILLAPVTAALVTDLILDNRFDPALQGFHPLRFSVKEGQAP
jgi:glycine oxidase